MHQKLLQSFIIIIIFILSFSCNAFAKYHSSFIVAKVNDVAITNLELRDRYQFVTYFSKMDSFDNAEKQNLLNQIIDKMIDEELIRQEAEQLGISNTEDEIQDAVDIFALKQEKTAAQFRIELLQKGISYDNYSKQIACELLWSKIISNVVRSRVKTTDVELKEFLEQQKISIDVRKLKLAQIYIPENKSQKNALKIASKLAQELKKGANFETIVKQFSGDSYLSQNNGEIGWVSQSDIDERIFSNVALLEKGEYSDPILLNDGYYIFKLLDIKTEENIQEQDLELARKAVFIRKLESLAKGYLLDLRKKSFIEVNRSYAISTF